MTLWQGKMWLLVSVALWDTFQLQDGILACVSIILVGDTWAGIGLCCETLMGTLLWGTVVPCHSICHLELKGTFAQPSLLCGNPLVAEIRILVCKQSQVRKYTEFK